MLLFPSFPSGYSASSKTPGWKLVSQFGSTAQGAGTAPSKVLLFGNMIESDITLSNPSGTIAAGTATLAQPVQITSADQAGALFGKGSELHIAAIAFFAIHENGSLHAIPVAKPSGSPARATVVITPTITTISASYTLRIHIDGEVAEVVGNAGDSVVQVGSLICLTINAMRNGNLPVYANYDGSTGAVTISFKHPGTRGNLCDVRFEFVVGNSSATLRGGTLAATIAGLTLTLSGGTAVGKTYRLSGGTGTDTLTAALAAIASTRYHYYCLASVDSTAIDLAIAQVVSMAGINTRLRQQIAFSSVDTYANTVTLCTGRNQARAACVWHYASDVQPLRMAAAYLATRLVGDGLEIIGEEANLAANLNGAYIKGIPVQAATDDRPTANAIEGALSNGFIPLTESTSTPGGVDMVASITTRSLDGATPNYSVWKTKVVTVADGVSDDIESTCAITYRGYKLQEDSENAPQIARVVQPRHIRKLILSRLRAFEEAGVVTKVEQNAPLVQVIIDPNNDQRVIMSIPEKVLPDLDTGVGTVVAL